MADTNKILSRITKRPVALALICVVLNSISQILLKIGSQSFGFDIIKIITSPHLIIGFIIYGISAVILVMALRRGNLSVVYPILAIGFITVNILAWFILGEEMSLLKWAGITAIVIGISFIGFASKKTGEAECQ